MDSERYRLVKQAFAAVTAARTEHRQKVLTRICGDDVELRREVEALLAHDRSEPGGVLSDVCVPIDSDFAPGQVVIGRYRVVSLAGRGGMGKVYRADDLVLGQPVALKFLPAHIAGSATGLDRFRGEVRHAREVTHPNVARVHDIGEVDGRHFLTMEFVDGEDLASLIRRIGRLPREKAAEIAQQVCAGLAEAHRKGVLHRDLKPANVMLDGEGRVRLTDFGLAVATGADGDSGLAGTPQYMAPELLSGVSASVQTEVYALGLLLYELYTGHRALRGRTLAELRLEHEQGGPDAPSSRLEDLDPGVDAVLTRCLNRDPSMRPRSVAQVARALPGGDPLAAALAAGETPPPDVVAAASTEPALTRGVATTLVVGAVALFLLLAIGRSWMQERSGISYGKPPAYLQERAREVAATLSGGDEFAHQLHWYTYDTEIAAATGVDEEPGASVDYPLPLVHHTSFLPVVSSGGLYRELDPAPHPGSMHVVLDANGRLVRWVHWAASSVSAEPAQSTPWRTMADVMGLPSQSLEAADPQRLPDVFADNRAAWRLTPTTEVAGESHGLRIEAAALGGRVVQVALVRETEGSSCELGTFAPSFTPQSVEGHLFWMVVLVLSAVLAWRNVNARRADVRGAIIIGVWEALAHIALLLSRPMPADATGAAISLSNGLEGALHLSVRVILLYLALEPFVRRRWPRLLVGWNRLLSGRLRDDSVGREILCGLLAAAVALATTEGLGLVSGTVGSGRSPFSGEALQPFIGLGGPQEALGHVLHRSGLAIIVGGSMVFSLVAIRSLVRVTWVAGVLWIALGVLVNREYAGALPAVVQAVIFLIALVRGGFLAVIVLWFAYWVFVQLPITMRMSDWYWSSSLVVLAVFGFLWFWAWRAATGAAVASGVPSRA